MILFIVRILLILLLPLNAHSHFDNKQHSIVHYYKKFDVEYKKNQEMLFQREKIKSSVCLKNYFQKKNKY